MMKKLSKSIAMALAAITLSLPFTTQALAAPHNDRHMPPPPPQKVEWRHDNRDNHKVQPKHQPPKKMQPVHNQQAHRYPAPPPKHEKHHSTGEKVAAGVIIGGIIGAILAKNS